MNSEKRQKSLLLLIVLKTLIQIHVLNIVFEKLFVLWGDDLMYIPTDVNMQKKDGKTLNSWKNHGCSPLSLLSCHVL